MLDWVKDYTVPIFGYVLRDASGQCHHRAIDSRNKWSYFGHLLSYFSGIHNGTNKHEKNCIFNMYYIYILWNKACESVISNKLMYILSINLLNIFCINA